MNENSISPQNTRSAKKSWKDAVLKIISIPEVGILVPLIVICLVFSHINPTFYSGSNIINILRNISCTGLIAIPMTYVFIAAGLDLSVGAVAGLAGVISGLAMMAGLPIPIAVACGLALGITVGLLNGIVAVYLKIPSFIVTLGMLYIARGMIYVLTSGENVYPLPVAFTEFGKASIAGIPYSVFILVIVALIADFVLRKTTYGRKIYAVGGNEEVASLAGINVKRIRLSTYILVALTSAGAGILLSARLGTAASAAGETWEMQSISAVIIGGTSMFGGVGTIYGVMLGAITMGVLSTGMTLVDVSTYWQNVVLGAIMVTAVGIDQLRRSRLGL
ncbi:MAG: ABC transporter permease [Armatimonadota bacterium]